MITYDFTGRVAFVTGAAAGTGASTARTFAEAGGSRRPRPRLRRRREARR